MADRGQNELQLEIGHVLFFDIVGYSKLLIDEQTGQIRKLTDLVRANEQFRLAEAEGKLLRLPTGDGGALVFRNNPEAPLLCAIEISRALKNHPELRVRIGILSGPVNEVAGSKRTGQHRGRGGEPCPTSNGLWRRRSHPAFAACNRGLGTLSSVAASSS